MYLISGSWDKTIRIWDLLKGEEISVLYGHTDHVICVVLSKDNQWIVSGSSDMTLRIWNFSTFQLEKVLSGHSLTVQAVAITTDAKFIVSGSLDSTIGNVGNGRPRRINIKRT